VKSFLLSTLLPELDLRDAAAFARAYPHPWLLRESRTQHPVNPTGATVRMPAPVAAVREDVGLAIALEPSRAGETRVTLGRGHACDVDLEEGTLSQLHCAFMHTDDGWRIEDLGSTNGTWVDGVRIAARQPVPITDGQRIQTALIHFTFHDSAGLWRRLEAEALRL
jgi:hypothetical protein